MGFASRLPDSNDPPRMTRKSRWLEETEFLDEFALLLNGLAAHCQRCKQAVRKKHLRDGQCPDCRG